MTIYKDYCEGVVKGVDVRHFETDTGLATQLDTTDADYFLVAFYGRKIPPEIVQQYKGRLFNLHPSPLPLFRGARPAEAMLAEHVGTGAVSIHEVEEEYDTGNVLGQVSIVMRDYDPFPLSPKESVGYFYKDACKKGARLFRQIIDNMDGITPVPQTQLESEEARRRLQIAQIANANFHNTN